LTFERDMAPPDRRAGKDYRSVMAGIRVLERSKMDRPFFLFLALNAPHPPYNAPAGFAGLHDPSDIADLLPTDLPDRPVHLRRMLQVSGLSSLPQEGYRKIRANYLDRVSYSDWLLGELMEAIDRTHHAQDTALFVTSDHGDYAGDFGLVEKWPSGMERCMTHVPMIARMPGCKAGHRVAEPVQLFDIMPTLLELAGTEATHTHFARSLVPQIFGAEGDHERAAFTEGGFNTYEAQCFEAIPAKTNWYYDRLKLQIDEPVTVSRVAAVRTAEYTFVSRPQGVSELYLRKNDPQERNNRFNDASVSSVRHKAEQALVHWYINTAGVAPMNHDPRGFPAAGSVPPAPRNTAPAAVFPRHTADVILDVG
jgi:choline-sulfatase